ncbi:MAG: hypothetical protein ABSH03_22295 [Candidatus Lustribacter sp.]|jgi:hypothetical protein
MLRRLAIVLAVLLLPLVALPSSAATPVLVVYPFAVSGAAPPELGVQLSAKIAAEIAALGGVKVVLGAASTKPADYRSAARAAGADLYFSGSIVPVFTNYSAIEQLVSTRSGVVAWSVMFQFHGLDDVTGQGSRVRDVLMAANATPSPGPAASGVELITPPPPLSGFAVLPLAGSAFDDDRQFATQSLMAALQQHGYNVSAVTGTATLDPAGNTVVLCTRTGAQTLIMGTLDTTSVATSGAATAQTTAHVSLQLYDCRKHAFAPQATVVNHIAPVAHDAIGGAVQDAVSALPAPS